jgi:hypothetical protein
MPVNGRFARHKRTIEDQTLWMSAFHLEANIAHTGAMSVLCQRTNPLCGSALRAEPEPPME